MFQSDSFEEISQSPFTDSLKGLLSQTKKGTSPLKKHNKSIIQKLTAFKNDSAQNSSRRSSILDGEDNQSQKSAGLESNSSGLVAKTADWHHQQTSSRHSILDSKYHTPSLGPALAGTTDRLGFLMSSKRNKQEAESEYMLPDSPKLPNFDKYRGQKYFEFNDFDAYVTSMSKAMGKADIKTKVQELKQLATSLKIIAETQSEEDMDRILGQHASFIPLAKPVEKKPLYKKVSEAGTDPLKLKSIKESIEASNGYNSRNSDENLRNSLTGLIHLQKMEGGSPMKASFRRTGVLNSLQTVDSHGRMNDAPQGDTFEAFLSDQGEIGTQAYTNMINANHIKNLIQENVSLARTTEGGGGGKPFGSTSATNLNTQPENNSGGFSFLKQQTDEPSSSSQLPSEGLTANLQLFLMQNLREIMEVKGILREGIALNTAAEAKENIQPILADNKSENSPPSILPQDNMNDQLQQRLQEGQMERLVNKIQVLNEKVKQLEEENAKNNFLGLFPKTCLRIGKIRMTEFIDSEFDFTKTTLENIYSTFNLNQKYVYIYTTHITICKDSNSAEEQGQNISLALIEQIYYLEKPGSTFFVLKLLEKAHEKDWYLESVRLGAQIKPRTFENVSGFYLIEVKDALEMGAWESVFFVLNFKAIAGNISFSSNKSEFLRALKLFVHKYIQVNGETVRPFTELSSNNSLNQFQSAVNQIQRMTLVNGELGRDKTGTVDFSKRKSTAIGSQLQSFMKTRIDDGERRDTDVSGIRRTLQKKSSLSRGLTPEDEISGFDNNNTVIEENLEESKEPRERSKSQYLQNLMRKSAIDFHDEEQIFSKHLKTLLEGMVFGKYGEWGKRHERHVRLSSDLKGIEWISPSDAKKKSKALEVDAISLVVAGNKSSYFMKKKLKQAELDLCFSIVARTKSIHLQAPDTKKKDILIEALDYILKEKTKLRRLADQAELESNKTRKSK